MTLQIKNIVRIALATALILLVPLGAMQFTPEVVWTPSDFVVAGVLLFGTGLAYELLTQKGGHTAYRLGMGMGLATALLLVWTNLAVGLIGNEHNPANLLYGGVLVVGGVGALLAQLRPAGMSRALFATALAQVLVPVVALFVWPRNAAPEAGVVVGVTAFFGALWVGAALLFRRASAAGATASQRLA